MSGRTYMIFYFEPLSRLANVTKTTVSSIKKHSVWSLVEEVLTQECGQNYLDSVGAQTDQMQYHDSSAVLSGISHSFGSPAKTSAEIQSLTLNLKTLNRAFMIR